MAAQRYPSEVNLPPADISNSMLYSIVTETRREVYQRLDEHSTEMRQGISEIKELLGEGKETFGRHDERLKGAEKRVGDLESDVAKISGKKIGDGSGSNKVNRPEKDFRVKVFNCVMYGAATAIGTLIGGYIVKVLVFAALADHQPPLSKPGTPPPMNEVAIPP